MNNREFSSRVKKLVDEYVDSQVAEKTSALISKGVRDGEYRANVITHNLVKSGVALETLAKCYGVKAIRIKQIAKHGEMILETWKDHPAIRRFDMEGTK